MTFEKPKGYEDVLGPYKSIVVDIGCSECIGWGFEIVAHLGEERFDALKKHGDLYCIKMGRWALIKSWLAPEEAVLRYGKPTKIIIGPHGGYRGCIYGETKFLDKRLDPRGKIIGLDNSITVKLLVGEKA